MHRPRPCGAVAAGVGVGSPPLAPPVSRGENRPPPCEAGGIEGGLISADKAPSDMADKTILIIGAGIAGLTAALTLADRGYSATIYEADKRVGGRIRSERGEGR